MGLPFVGMVVQSSGKENLGELSRRLVRLGCSLTSHLWIGVIGWILEKFVVAGERLELNLQLVI